MTGFDPSDKESWYFGALKRPEAQEILENEEEPTGAFLVRDSNTCPGDFVICVKEETMVRHYIIKKMELGDDGRYCFKIGTEIFTDVASLLKYYTYNYLDTTLLSKPARKFKFIGLFDFPGKDPEDLPFKKGEILVAIKKNEEDWWTARNQAGRTGSIPSPYVEIYKGSSLDSVGDKEDVSGIHSESSPDSSTVSVNSTPRRSNDKNFKSQTTNLANKLPHANGNLNKQSPLFNNTSNIVQHHFALPRKNLPAYALVRQARNPNAYDKTALKLKVGEVIKVTKMNINGQWEGELNGKTGFFPFTHIQFIDEDKIHQFLSAKQHRQQQSPPDKKISVPTHTS